MNQQPRDRGIAVREIQRLVATQQSFHELARQIAEPAHALYAGVAQVERLEDTEPGCRGTEHQLGKRIENRNGVFGEADALREEVGVGRRFDVGRLLVQGQVVEVVNLATDQLDELVVFRTGQRQVADSRLVIADTEHHLDPLSTHLDVAIRTGQRHQAVGRRAQQRDLTHIGRQRLEVDAEIIKQALRDLAVVSGGLQVDRSTDAEQRLPVLVKLVALRVPAKVVMVVQ